MYRTVQICKYKCIGLYKYVYINVLQICIYKCIGLYKYVNINGEKDLFLVYQLDFQEDLDTAQFQGDARTKPDGNNINQSINQSINQ